MLETLLDSAAGGSLSGRLRRIPVRDGVRAWDFDCALSLPSSLPAAIENRYQILFCRSGALRLELAVGKQLFLHEREVLLLAPARRSCALPFLTDGSPVRLSSSRYPNATVCRIFSAHCSAACRSTPHGLRAPARTGGCAVLRGTPWTETVFPRSSHFRPRNAAATARSRPPSCSTCSARTVRRCLCRPRRPAANAIRSSSCVRCATTCSRISLTRSPSASSPHASTSPLPRSRTASGRPYGRPLHQYLLEHRVRRAAELLSESGLSIVEIASAVGYNSASQFGVAFKRRYQLTPSQFRRMAHSQRELRQDT